MSWVLRSTFGMRPLRLRCSPSPAGCSRADGSPAGLSGRRRAQSAAGAILPSLVNLFREIYFLLTARTAHCAAASYGRAGAQVALGPDFQGLTDRVHVFLIEIRLHDLTAQWLDDGTKSAIVGFSPTRIKAEVSLSSA